MRTQRFIMIMLVIGMLTTGLLASAQADMDTFSFDNGATFMVPAGTTIEVYEDLTAAVNFELVDGSFIEVMNTPFFTEDAGLETDAELVDVLEWYVDWRFEGEFAFSQKDVERLEFDGREAASYSFEFDEDRLDVIVAVRFADGSFGVVDGFGEPDSITDQTLAIAATFDAGEMVVEAGDCSISTTQSNTVQLRVGPGTNRTVYAFLPANIEFTPLGQSEADDGSLWFQLDKAEVAPQAAAAEAWVAGEDVDTSGNCTTIGEATAPPIVPIISAPPASSPNDSGSAPADSGGGSSTIAPAPGTWTVIYNPTGKASCLGTGTLDFPVQIPNEVANLQVTSGAVIVDGDRLNQIQPNVYSGLFDVGGGESVQLTLRSVSPTQFTGEGRLNLQYEGVQCSGTIYLSLTRN